MSNYPFLNDRIKQFSTDTGTGSLVLGDQATGFTSFSDAYGDGEDFFYAITDGVRYEIGSGTYVSSTNQIQRHAIITSNRNSNNVNFPAGKKEIFVTHPATHAIMMGSGLANHNVPARRGIAFWESSHTLNYDSELYWNDTLKHLGIRTNTPEYGIDVKGDGTAQSMVRASGFVVGPTGIHFPQDNGGDSSYEGGIQYQHFSANELYDQNLNDIIELSGNVHNIFKLKEQNAGYVFAGPIPPAECQSNCGEALPSFRALEEQDLPNTIVFSGSLIATSGYLSAYTDSEIAALSGYLEAESVGALSGYLQGQITDNDTCCDSQQTHINELNSARTFSVTSDGNGNYSVSGVGTSGTANPPLMLSKGLTYEFAIDAPAHPFWIKHSGVTGTEGVYNSGVTNNGTDSGAIKFTVPNDSPSRLYYICENHASMSGVIHTIPTESLMKYSESTLSEDYDAYIGKTYYTDEYMYVYTSQGWKRSALQSMTVPDNLVDTPEEDFEDSEAFSEFTSPFTASNGSVVNPTFSIIENGSTSSLSRNSIKIDVDGTDLADGTSLTVQVLFANDSGNFNTGSVYNLSTLTTSAGGVSTNIPLPLSNTVSKHFDPTSTRTMSSTDTLKFRVVPAASASATFVQAPFSADLENNVSLSADLFIGGNWNNRAGSPAFSDESADYTYRSGGYSKEAFRNIPIKDRYGSSEWNVEDTSQNVVSDKLTDKNRFNNLVWLWDYYDIRDDYDLSPANNFAQRHNRKNSDNYGQKINIETDLYIENVRQKSRTQYLRHWNFAGYNNDIFNAHEGYPPNFNPSENYSKGYVLTSSERKALSDRYRPYCPLSRISNSSSMGGITHLAMSPENPHLSSHPTSYYAITRNGNAYAWGCNTNNQLGIDPTILTGYTAWYPGITVGDLKVSNYSDVMVQTGKIVNDVAIEAGTEMEEYASISELKFVSVEAGEGFAIFLTDDGKVYETGDHYFDPSYTPDYDSETYEAGEYIPIVERTFNLSRATFKLVNTGNHTIEKISVYDNTAYALDSDGNLHMWGSIYRATKLPFEDGLIDPQYDESRQMIIGAFPPMASMTYVGLEAPIIYSHPTINFDDVRVGYDHVLLRSGTNLYSIGSTNFNQANAIITQNPDMTAAFIDNVKSYDFSMSAGYQVSVYINESGDCGIFGQSDLGFIWPWAMPLEAGFVTFGAADRVFISKTYDPFATVGIIDNKSFYMVGWNNGWGSYQDNSIESNIIESKENTGINSSQSVWGHWASERTYIGEFQYPSLVFSPPYSTHVMAMNRHNIMFNSTKAMYKNVGDSISTVEKRDTIPTEVYNKKSNWGTVGAYGVDGMWFDPDKGATNWGLFACAHGNHSTYTFMRNWGHTANHSKGGLDK